MTRASKIAGLTAIALVAMVVRAPAQQASSFQGQSQATGTLNGSVVITTGNTFQTVLAALTATTFPGTPSRRALTIENNNANGDNCWVFIGAGTAAKGTAILLGQGGSYTRYWPYVPSDAIQATCVTTSDTLYVDTQ